MAPNRPRPVGVDPEAYEDGRTDAVNGRQKPWKYLMSPSYDRGYMAGLREVGMLPKHRSFWRLFS